MTLFHVDQTETQTDCPKPLSRKKLRQLRWHHPASTSGGWLEQLLGRRRGKAYRSRVRHETRTKVLAQGKLEDGAEYKLQQQVPVTLFDRMKATLKVALGKFQRAQKRGGQA